jgi:hypothetical protein
MRLLTEPAAQSPLFDSELELVICLREESPPEIFLQDGMPRPDRHMLLGMIQTIVVAAEEMDSASVAFVDSCSTRLERGDEMSILHSDLIIIRAIDGRFGALAIGDKRSVRRLARRAERWFTGTIRLDVP